MAQYHVIKQQTADILFSEREKAADVFTDVSRLFNNRMRDITETVFDEHVEEDVLVRIDTLEVDLGIIPYPFPEEEMATKYRAALEAALLLKLTEIQNNKGQQHEEPEAQISISLKAFLEHYLLTGSLPWWGSDQDMNDPEKVFGRLLGEERDALKVLIERVAQHGYVRKRLVYGFTEKVVQDVIYLIEPGQAAFILEYHKDVSEIQKKEQLVKAEATEFEKAVWIFILDYLFDDRGSHFSRKLFVKYTLTAMAARFNLSFTRILFLFEAAIQTAGELLKYADALPSIIKELAAEMAYSGSTATDADEFWEEPGPALSPRYEKYSVLSLYLLTGSFTPGAIVIERDYLIAVFLDLVKTAPQLMKELLLGLGDIPVVKKRLAHEFNDEVVKALIRLIEPANADFMINYSEVTIKIQEDKSIVKAEGSVFKNVLWEFILTFLFSERGSVFNKRMFLESNIRQLAKHYNIEFHTLLSFLAQGITEELSIISDNSSLFYMLIDILKETNSAYKQDDVIGLAEAQEAIITGPVKKGMTKDGVADAKADLAEQERVSKTIFIKNLLLFWMEHGYLPWWAINGTDKRPEQLLDELISRFPDEAVLLFQQAMVNYNISYAFFQTHSQAVFKIAEHMNDGKTVLSYPELMRALQAELKSVYQQADLQAVLAMAMMEAYKASRFGSFNESTFFSFYIQLLARETGSDIKEVADVMITTINTIGTAKQAAGISKFIKTIEPSLGSDTLYVINSGFPEEEALRLIARFPVKTSAAVISTEERVTQILQYFLQYNKLPEELAHMAHTRLDDFIFRLLIVLNRLNSAAVSQLLAKDHLSSSAKVRVHDLFLSRSTTEAASVKASLLHYYERDLIHFITDNGLSVLEQEAGLKEMVGKAMAQSNATKRKQLLVKLMASPSLAHYIARNYKGEDYYETLQVMASEKAVALVKKLQYAFGFIAADSFERENLNELLRAFSLLWFAENAATTISDSVFIRAFLKFLAQKKNWNMHRLSEQFYAAQKNAGVFVPVGLASFMTEIYGEVLYLAEDRKYRAFLQESYLKPSVSLLKDVLPEIVQNEAAALEQNRTSSANEEVTQKPAKELLMNEQIYIQNAGLILLHPFLSTYFTRTGLMHEGKFSGVDKQFRAPYLLQYAATGNEENPEHQMVLNKILSGINAEEALPKITALTEQEKQVSNELLQVVIQQWDKMKNTSVEGFRASFLQRNGALTLTPEAWVLKIEQRGYDILLQTLPWGMGMIKTSWMDKPLIVEWI
jgi:hypothetical protein